MKTSFNCVCCNSSSTRFYRQELHYILNKCKSCSLVYLTNADHEDVEFITQVENNEVEFWSVPNLFHKYDSIFKGFFNQRLERIKKYNNGNKYFDLGAGYGFWQQFLMDEGNICDSIEPDNSCYKYAKEEFHIANITHTRFEEYQTNNKYNAITMIDVLEHLNEPKKMLYKTREMLEENGVIYIQVPNVLGLKIPWGHNLGLPFHLWQFNKKSLYKLLENSGYEPLEYWTGVQGIIGKHEKGGPSIVDKTLWAFANIFKCGNRIQVIARKK
jgi:2-polyprenyl-3-methyl-5-hydroxy-6-metoxy-1,4-benzoquinol methylase